MLSKIIDTYTSLGCWKDKEHDRAIPILEGKSSLLDGSSDSRKDPIQKCFEAAKYLGYDIFAVQAGGWCSSSATAKSTYKKHGASVACNADGEGGESSNTVYEIIQGRLLIQMIIDQIFILYSNLIECKLF